MYSELEVLLPVLTSGGEIVLYDKQSEQVRAPHTHWLALACFSRSFMRTMAFFLLRETQCRIVLLLGRPAVLFTSPAFLRKEYNFYEIFAKFPTNKVLTAKNNEKRSEND
jgi:hypothetical protein